MMGNLAKIMYATVTEGRIPAELLQSFLGKYRTIPTMSTGIAPSVLLFGRSLKTRLLTPSNPPQKDKVNSEVRKKDKEKKLSTKKIQIKDAGLELWK